MVKRKLRTWKNEKTRVLHAIVMSINIKTRHNWSRVDLPRHIAEDIETLEYKNKVFVVRYKRTNERYVVEMKDANLRQLEEFKRFIKDDGILIKPKISRDELPFSGTEKGSPMQKKKPVKKTKIVAVRPKAHVEITIERMGKHTRITMPKSMDNDTVCLVIK